MTRLGITMAEVEEAAEQILAKGENPTIEKIRQTLGTGSNSTISKYLNEWRKSRLIATTDYYPAPQLPPDPVNAAVNQVWEKIRNESAAEIKNYQEKAQKEIELANIERDLALNERDQLKSEILIHSERFNKIHADKELLALDFKSLQGEHSLLQERCNHLNSEYELFKQETQHQITLLQTINKQEMADKQTIIKSMQEAHNAIIQQLFTDQEKCRADHANAINEYKVEQQKLIELKESLSEKNHNLNSELQSTKEVLKYLTLEKELIVNDYHTKNKFIIEQFHLIFEAIESIKKFNEENDLALKIIDLNAKTDQHKNILSSILNILQDLTTMTHEDKEIA